MAQQWLDSNPSKRPSTRARDDGTLRLHLLPALGLKPIGQITPADVQSLVKRWLTERKPSSVSRDYRTLAAICRFAVDQDLLVVHIPAGTRRVALELGGPASPAPH